MKKNIIAIALSTLVATGISCKKVLETKPTDFLAPENYFSNETQVDQYLNSVYDGLNEDVGFYRSQYRTQITEGTDESYSTSDPNTTYTVHYRSSSEIQLDQLWTKLYQGIDRANVLLENINKNKDMTEAKKRHVIGETKFLRAYYHFIATQWWGDVPLKTISTKSAADAQIAFTPTKDVYDFVIKEMTEAEDLLKDQTATSLGYTERITYTTVQGILARVCLYAAGNPVNDTKRYAEALAWAAKVKASGEHKLIPDYRQIFINESADKYDNVNREVMWEIGFYFDATRPALREILNTLIGVNSAVTPYGRTQASTRTTAVLYRAYSSIEDAANKSDISLDVRRDWCISPYILSGGSATTNPTEVAYPWNAWWNRYPNKWRRQFETARPIDANNSPQNFPVLRYADVLLMLAEAENEVNGPTTTAYNAINEVRRRAFGTGKRVSTIAVTNGGSGYTSVPMVTIERNFTQATSQGSFGDGAYAVAEISGGKVTAIRVVSTSAFYNTAPVVTITGGGGTGATAVATVVDVNPAANELTSGLSKDEFRKAIQEERLRELNGECLRRQDLKRWGILLSAIQQRSNLASSGGTITFTDLGTRTVPGLLGTPAVPAFSNPSIAGAGAPGATDRDRATIDGANVSDKWMFLPIPGTEISRNRLAQQNQGH